jgi:hypothetical protein
MNPNSYTVGTKVTMTGTFRDVSGALVDPTTVTAMVNLPDGSVVDISSTLINVSVGVYTVTYVPTQAGGHDYRIQGTGNCQVASDGSFNATSLF